ncbi:transketolase [Kitasatospora sp. NPDC056138]|uniref:transketolase n=1 Tax=Kitasatospora sp. NPDC056138 TaxID=3345724 RepID=UPI0035E2B4B6
MTDSTDTELAIRARQLRIDVIDLIRNAGNGHMAGSLSCLDFLYVLYKEVLNISPDALDDPDRDRYVQSKGHAVEALYVVLAECGFFDRELLDTYLKFGSDLVGHATRKVPGIEQSTGALGHGLSLGAGMAIAGKEDGRDYRVFVLLGDGELAEGSVWEAAMCAGHYRLDNLVAVVDRNRLQIAGRTDDLMRSEPLADKFASFGWAVREVDGHDVTALKQALTSLPVQEGKPGVIIMNTVKGSGISYMEHNIRWHHKVPTDAEYATAVADVNHAVELLRSGR